MSNYRVYNFSAGPAVLPEEVLQIASQEMLNYGGSGMSVMEMSHRSSHFQKIIDGADALLREIMNIPKNYKVLFLQGGASSQFFMIPMNLMKPAKKADYLKTGSWAVAAIKEAKRFGQVTVVGDSSDKAFSYIPEIDPKKFTPDADYFHITSNNTIEGTYLAKLPNTGSVPIVADMSSNILSEVIDVSKYGVIYAGAQKNIGPAGVTIVIIREDLLSRCSEELPTMLNYQTHVKDGSMFNTPPTYAIYISKLVFEYIKKIGGIKAVEEINRRKAALLYDAIDSSKMFRCTVANKAHRSLMNVPFVSTSEELNDKFIKAADKNGLVTLKGHRSVGGMRASIYNAMPEEGVKKLVDFMKKFEMENR
ncbi:MAG: 3-phosphoserine/phosphohydroxythreonine transaminase [Chitinivibrionales bacterium]|nr:3-phosphoserine/phosphohydroxythreonine transaminase [Chitinivibrionales bacterium]